MTKWRQSGVVVLLLLLAAPAWGWSGKVVKVTDGDTITVLRESGASKDQVKIRLYGIDCPEKKQPFGAKAKDKTSELAALKVVEVEEIDRDRYGRTVGLVTLPGGVLLNEELVKVGLAWVYPQYCRKDFCRKWTALQREARLSSDGLWNAPDPTPPWEWRKR